jgi:CHASE2 domain-containing sensor protein
MIAAMTGGTRRQREIAAHRRARRTGAVGFLAALLLPIVLWHRVVANLIAAFRLDARYLIGGWSPWVLMAFGLGCVATAGIIDWRQRDRRFYAPGGAAWAAWGISLYLLGFGLATQVAQIAGSFARS